MPNPPAQTFYEDFNEYWEFLKTQVQDGEQLAITSFVAGEQRRIHTIGYINPDTITLAGRDSDGNKWILYTSPYATQLLFTFEGSKQRTKKLPPGFAAHTKGETLDLTT